MEEGSTTNLVTSNLDNSGDLKDYYDALTELERRNQEQKDFQVDPLGDPLDRWPTLFEILNKKTQAPVDLWSFYEFMRDEQRSINYLDFWIDTVQHLNLCKIYVMGLKDSIVKNSRARNSKALQLQNDTTVSTGDFTQPTLDRPRPLSEASMYSNQSSSRDSKSSSMLLDLLMKNNMFESQDPHRLSTFLRGETAVRSSDPLVNFKIDELKRRSKTLEDITGDTTQEERQSAVRASRIFPEMVEALIESDINPQNKTIERSHLITRKNLRQSSNMIYNTYFNPSSERHILIPQELAADVQNAIINAGRDDPEVFDAAREYVFKSMEYDAYPLFLRTHALRNVTERSATFRLLGSILSAMAGFWAAYYMIFYNDTKSNRGALVVPFFFMCYLFFTAFYSVDPILCFFGYGESRSQTVGLTHWREPYAKRLLLKRSLFILGLILLSTAAFSVLFGLVPGHRLKH